MLARMLGAGGGGGSLEYIDSTVEYNLIKPPSAHQPGDLLIAAEIQPSLSVSVPSGWADLTGSLDDGSPSGYYARAFYKIAGASEPSLTRADGFVSVCCAWRGNKKNPTIGNVGVAALQYYGTDQFPVAGVSTSHSQSWIAVIALAAQSDAFVESNGPPISGMTNRLVYDPLEQLQARSWDSNGTKTSLAAQTVTVGNFYGGTVLSLSLEINV